MECIKCGAPLPARTSRCSFCSALNDIDLRRLECRYESTGVTQRICPRCDRPMDAIRVDVASSMTIERCDTCLGLFFDPNEIEALLDANVNPNAGVDLKRLQRIIEDETPEIEHQAMYVKCPACRKMMNRDKFGARSGVIVDRCAMHGVWMDGGELSQLLKWMSAGGKTLSDARQHQEQERKEGNKGITQTHLSMTDEVAHEEESFFDFDLDDNRTLPYLIGAAIGFFLK